MGNQETDQYVNNLPLHSKGKVRETYEIPKYPNLLLMVATDKVSTHNIVHKSVIPQKGYILTAMTIFWMQDILAGIPNHLVAFGKNIYDYLPSEEYPKDLHLRSIVVRKLDMTPVEFIFRGRMAGSFWANYYSKGKPNPYEIELPPGLQLMSLFEEPIFTPTDKSENDYPKKSRDIKSKCPDEYLLALDVYNQGRKYALERGIEIIDTKVEVGCGVDGEWRVGDEILTSDSSRFVLASEIVLGQDPRWLDKQFVRDEAERKWGAGERYPLRFTARTINETSEIYGDVFKKLTGLTIQKFQRDRLM